MDSNHRPPPYQGGALTDWATFQNIKNFKGECLTVFVITGGLQPHKRKFGGDNRIRTDDPLLARQVNSNCDDEKGLDLLILDEILEAVDEEGLSSMFDALNALGGTVLVVSHGNVAESYPHKLVITKENGESRICK